MCVQAADGQSPLKIGLGYVTFESISQQVTPIDGRDSLTGDY